MFLRSIKELHRLKSKGMSNIYLSNSYCKKADVLCQNVDLASLKIRLQVRFWRAPIHAVLNFKRSC